MARITSSYTPQPIGEVVVRENLIPTYPSLRNSFSGWTTYVGVSPSNSPDGLVLDATQEVFGSILYRSSEETITSPGEVWSEGIEVEVPTGYPAVMLALVFYWPGASTFSDVTLVTVSEGETVRLTTTATAPSGATNVRVTLQGAGAGIPAGSRMIIRDATLERATSSPRFFDGSTPAAGEITYRWTGAPNASTSEEVLTLYDSVTESAPRLVLGYRSQREARTIVHHVLDRTDPDVSLRAAGLRTGQLDLFYLTEQDAYDAEVMHSMPAKFQFVEDGRPTTSMTYVVTEGDIERRLDDETRTRWVVSVPYAEVAP